MATVVSTAKKGEANMTAMAANTGENAAIKATEPRIPTQHDR